MYAHSKWRNEHIFWLQFVRAIAPQLLYPSPAFIRSASEAEEMPGGSVDARKQSDTSCARHVCIILICSTSRRQADRQTRLICATLSNTVYCVLHARDYKCLLMISHVDLPENQPQAIEKISLFHLGSVSSHFKRKKKKRVQCCCWNFLFKFSDDFLFFILPLKHQRVFVFPGLCGATYMKVRHESQSSVKSLRCYPEVKCLICMFYML